VVDARLCISYLTIEHQGAIPLALRSLMGNRIYGCDDCQLVCPWNKYAQMTVVTDFLPRHGLDQADLLTLWQWDEAHFLRITEGSPIRRIGYQRWRRNLAVALGNTPSDQRIQQALSEALPLANELVAEHIDWALQQGSLEKNTLTCVIQRSFLP
jgi:epoxyqueuosine reductase